MLYILYGEDNFSIQEAISEIKGGLGDPDLLSTNTHRLDGRQLSAAELGNFCQTVPFLAPKRLILVEGLLSRFSAPGRQRGRPTGQPKAEAWQPLVEVMKSLPEHAVLVLVDGRLEEGNPLLKALAPLARAENFRPLRGAKLIAWLQQRVAKAGGSIAPEAAKKLAEVVGENLWAMLGEIEKLILYTGGRRIGVDDVSRVTSHAREADVFTLVDALLGRNLATASRELHSLLAGGAAPAYLIYMISRQLRLLILARELLDNRASREMIQQRLGLSHAFVLDKTIEQARRFSLERLAEAYRRLLGTDLSIKTGQLPGETALELFLVELIAGGDAG